jgi:hypothetical protein
LAECEPVSGGAASQSFEHALQSGSITQSREDFFPQSKAHEGTRKAFARR